MSDDFERATLVVLLSFALGGIVAAGIFTYELQGTLNLKDACEDSLPRNQHCVMHYLPENNQ